MTTEARATSETEVNQEIHQAATVFLITDELEPRALLVQHRKLKVWLPPGGHVNSTETPYEAAIREVREESGIDISDFLPKPERLDNRAMSLPIPSFILLEDISAREDDPSHRHQDSVFVVRVPYQEAVRAEEESEDIRWFRRNTLGGIRMYPNVRDLLLRVLDPSNRIDKTQE